MTDDDVGALLAAPLDAPLNDVLDQVLDLVLPSQYPPPLAGAAIWDDIWNAVQTLVDFITYPNQLMGWLWDKVVMKLWDHIWLTAVTLWTTMIQPGLQLLWGFIQGQLNWLWGLAIKPAFQYLWALVKGQLDWLWFNALQPSLQWLQDHIGDLGDWLWENAIRPAFQWTWAFIEAKVNWLWENAVRPAFEWTWGVVQNVANWLWTNAIRPAFEWTWGVIESWARWTADNIVFPALDWIGDRLNDLRNLTQESKDFVTNTVWPAIEAVPETITNVTIAGAQALGEGFQAALQWVFDHVFDPIADAIGVKLSIPRKLLNAEYANLNQLLDDLEDPIPYGSFFGGMQAALAVPGIVMSLSSEVGRIIAMDAVQRWAQHMGATLPSTTDLRDAYLRNLITPAFHHDQLRRFGFSEGWANAITDLYFEIPTPSDLVRMAVREAFTPEVVSSFGLHEDFPADFERFGRQVGISHDWALAHWAAHWDLPSATQGFDMFHRALDSPAPGTEGEGFTIGGESFYHVISFDTLQLLLRTLDYMPFWRPKLTAIAYRPVSRIDIRRMFAAGAATKRDVLRTYLSLGYTPEDAQKLTDYVTRDAAAATKDLSRETILTFYRDAILARDEASTELLELGFEDEVVEMLLTQADLAVQRQLSTLAEQVFEAQFKAGEISEAELRDALAFVGVRPSRINLLVTLWTRELAIKPAKLTTSQVQRLFHENVISRPQAEFMLAGLGYTTQMVGWLLQLATPEALAPEARELSKEDLRNALREELLPAGEVRARLLTMGYAAGDADLLLQLWTPEPKEADLTKADLKSAFRAGILDATQVRDALLRQGYDAAESDALITMWTPAPDVEALSRADLRAAFRAGRLDELTVRNRLVALGYPPSEAAILIDTWRPAPAAA